MDNNFTNIEFVRKDSFGERSKIYEKLDYTPQPPDYKGKLPWTVQQQIAATNGIQYADRVGPCSKKDYILILLYQSTIKFLSKAK